ncbi:hypothetical protein KQX54_013216 [Cotesia glomerata]|uniref:EB domain-containing protein n=1 Tax=Cotesia glomerata TaxID=32391 RepID=A0AAV7J0Z4_COTGL|nr:hypothetical protein KQX54_013216 [Cotesia glomerata]
MYIRTYSNSGFAKRLISTSFLPKNSFQITVMKAAITCPACYHPENPWFVSELMHQSKNDSSFKCSKPFMKLNPRTVASSILRNLKKIWTRRGEDWSEDSSILARKIWRSFGGCTWQVKQLRTGAKILRKGNIIPGNKYKAQEILDILAGSLHGKKPLLRCSLESGLFSTKILTETVISKCNSTSRKDNNGHYIFEQQSDQFTCYEDDISKCKAPGTSWEFNPDITFSCEPSEDFNAKNISSIEQELFDKWGAARTDHTDVEETFGFRWKFETRCNAYFKGLDRNSYTYQAILNAISMKIHGKKADIECTREHYEDVIYLDKITIYFDQNFSPIDRIDKEDSQSCPIDKMIYYRDSVVLRSRQPQPSGPNDYALCNPKLKNACCDLNTKCKLILYLHYTCDQERGLGKFCLSDRECDHIVHAKCSKKNRCVCRPKNLEINGTCVPLLEGFCWNNEECATTNAVCIDRECRCTTGFIQNFDQCISNFNSLGAYCQRTETCAVENSFCIDHKCQCMISTTSTEPEPGTDERCPEPSKYDIKIDFTLRIKEIFYLDLLENDLYFCFDAFDCSDLWHSLCSKDKKCICQPDNIAINKSCLPSLNGYCWRHDQCMTLNSECSNNRCACKSDFIAVANNLCVHQ